MIQPQNMTWVLIIINVTSIIVLFTKSRKTLFIVRGYDGKVYPGNAKIFLKCISLDIYRSLVFKLNQMESLIEQNSDLINCDAADNYNDYQGIKETKQENKKKASRVSY